MIDWTTIILAVITLLGTILTKVLVPYLMSITTEKQRKNIDYWVQVAVIYIEKNYPDVGKYKKSKVIEIVKDLGLNIPEEQLNILIDEVVERIINNPYKELMEGD